MKPIEQIALEVAQEQFGILDFATTDIPRFAKALIAAVDAERGEPVAWMSAGGDVSRSKKYFDEMGFESDPLYLHPQPTPQVWIPVSEELPPEETPVLIIWNGNVIIGERRWEHPTHEETFQAYWYWDDPNDDGQDWGREEVTHWMPIPAIDAAMKGES